MRIDMGAVYREKVLITHPSSTSWYFSQARAENKHKSHEEKCVLVCFIPTEIPFGKIRVTAVASVR